MSLCGFFAQKSASSSVLNGYLKEVKPIMTLNVIFFTITIKKRKVSVEEALHNELVMKIYEENHDRHMQMQRTF